MENSSLHLIRVIPIDRGMNKDMLTYFSTTPYTAGHVVEITVRNRKLPGIIHSVTPLRNEKSEIKQLSYNIKKITAEESNPFFTPQFMKATESIATHHAVSQGAVIEALTPGSILREPVPSPVATEAKNRGFDLQIFQADDETRFAHYKSIIREEFAQKKSVFILVPTTQDADFLKGMLEKGIEEYAYTLHGSMTKKSTLHAWKEICNEVHPVLVISTALFLSLPKAWSTIIIERESSRHYKMNARPFLDMRTAAEMIAKEIGAVCICADVLLRIETLVRHEHGEGHEVSQLTWRRVAGASCHLVDMRQYHVKEGFKKTPFKLISDELNELIKENKRTGRRLFIYVARRGLSLQIVCKDCGTVVRCNHCSGPVVLHGGNSKTNRFFLCHTCGEKRSADELCRTCGSWNLESLGIGIESVIKDISSNHPEINLYRIDADATPTTKKALEQIDNFYTHPGSILVGTDMALYYLKESIEHVVIASLDALFSLPDFRIQEKIFHTILRLRSLASHIFLAQTRHADNNLWQWALKGNLMEYYREEKKVRKQFDYPPFVTLIKITYAGTPALVRTEMQKLKEQFADWQVSIFPAFLETKKGKFFMHTLIRIRKGSWPDAKLLDLLRSLPPSYSVNVDPENLL
jgi:primosomal protein N' (replication factor Y) (superfamily II helicase)